ncbi:hypothetical protein EDD99_1768 [Streptomyces sp. 846.5]|nr:hypothetical protein [Streptomyces sp. 846.5]TDU03346.1 hypothetical protein EDD99_1768 [Streptomyces sp. 846.5]
MAYTDDEKPRIEDGTDDEPEVVAHGVLGEDDSFNLKCPLMLET